MKLCSHLFFIIRSVYSRSFAIIRSVYSRSFAIIRSDICVNLLTVFNKFSVYQLVKDSVRKTRELKIFYLVYSVSSAFKIRRKHCQSLGCVYILKILTICCIEIRNKKAVTTISQAPHTSTMYKYIPNMRLEEERSNYFYNCTCSFIMHIRLVIFCFSDS